MRRPAARSGASTLMLVLWALVLLSAAVFAWAQWVDHGIAAMCEANRGMEARALAHSGMAVAMHPGVGRVSPLLTGQFGRGQSYHVTIESEGGRLNLNCLLAGADPRRIAYLKNYLALRGLNFQQREVFTDCLLDWVGPRTAGHRLNAPPESETYRPPHRPLQSLDEIPLIAGSAPLVARPDWKDELTLYSTGVLDLESVSADLLALVPGIGEQRAQRFVEAREERLKRSEDPNGYPFKNVAEALGYLGLSRDQFFKISDFLGFRDPVVRIESVGQSEKVIRQTGAVVRKVPGANAQILLWIEK